MSISPSHDGPGGLRAFLLAAMIAAAAGSMSPLALAADQKTFPTPEAAAKALVDAARADDKSEILAILGSDAKDIVSSGDEVQDKAAAAQFAAKAQQMMRLDQTADGVEVMSIGADDWPFPIPIVKKADAWHFDTAAGRQEILNRRVGANELATIEVCRAYVEAQRAYAAKDREGNGVIKYAQRFLSSPGKHDGLYWPVAEGEEASPLGPLVADAVAEGYGGKHGVPYHGYFYRILTAQGRHAPGGAYGYVINGNMVAGFALVAYPAQYGVSGVMTFIVNQAGVVYQKDLGLKTAELAKAMQLYDPDPSWQRVE
ncbi:MAG TPA: DUF2950 domain-containing protein [Dongiaceae bacterium]|nr:DUF2950 domain-containing protein [Dongiaceae bacterium]